MTRAAAIFCSFGAEGAGELAFENAAIVPAEALSAEGAEAARLAMLAGPGDWPVLAALAESGRLDAIILAHAGPVDALARALAAGEPSETALAAFCEEAARLLDFAARFENCAVIDLARAAAAPQTARQALEARFGLVLREDRLALADRPDALFRLLAQQSIARSQKARVIAEGLASAAIVAGENDETQLLAEALETARALKRDAGRAALLKTHLAVVQGQVETVFRRDVGAGGGETADIRIAALRTELFAARAEAEALRASLSWRLAAPLRAALAVLPRGVWRRGFRLRRRIALLKASPLFDAEWYAARYPDIAGGGLEPAEHYLRFGWREGRRPGPDFDPADYLRANPDVAALGVDPLLHYLQHGRGEGRLLAPARREEGAP